MYIQAKKETDFTPALTSRSYASHPRRPYVTDPLPRADLVFTEWLAGELVKQLR
jgi:hypothetical protein